MSPNKRAIRGWTAPPRVMSDESAAFALSHQSCAPTHSGLSQPTQRSRPRSQHHTHRAGVSHRPGWMTSMARRGGRSVRSAPHRAITRHVRTLMCQPLFFSSADRRSNAMTAEILAVVSAALVLPAPSWRIGSTSTPRWGVLEARSGCQPQHAQRRPRICTRQRKNIHAIIHFVLSTLGTQCHAAISSQASNKRRSRFCHKTRPDQTGKRDGLSLCDE